MNLEACVDLQLDFSRAPEGREWRAVLRELSDPQEAASGAVSAEAARRAARMWTAAASETLEPRAASQLGDAVESLLPASIRSRLEGSFAPAGTLRLWITAPPPLSELPWELLRLELAGGDRGHVVRDGRVAIIRAHAVDLSPQPPAPRPWNVLVAWADPGSGRYGLLPQARDEAQHVLRLLRAAGTDSVWAHEMPDATPAALRRRLAEAAPDLFCWIGHGDLRPSGGVLVLQGERPGEHAWLYADELAGWLRPGKTRLVVLSSCHSGAPDAFAGPLTAGGVPAMIGMQHRVGDRAARDFARLLVGALLRTGDVEAAVRMGRSAGSDDQLGWAAPVLHLSGRETRLFTPLPEETRPANRLQIPFRRPHQLVGREVDLEHLHAALMAPVNRPVALVGLGGIGKTQLAVEYAHRCRSSYPGGVFWVQGQDAARLVEDLASLARFWDIPENASPQRRAELVRDALQSETEPCLLVVDNAVAQTPFDLLPSAGPCRVLVTCRQELPASLGWVQVKPERLSLADSLDLLLGPGGARSEAELEAGREIARFLDGLPLALVLARYHVERLDVTLTEYRDRLAGNRMAVLEAARRRFITDTRHDGGIFDAIDLSCRDLTPSAQQVLQAAACFAGRRVSVELLHRACALPDRSAFEEALSDLKDTCLVSREERGRLGMHELVRVFVQGRFTEGRDAAVQRVANVLLAELRAANENLDWNRIRPELAHCRAVLDLCRERRLPQLVPLLRELGRHSASLRDNTVAVERLSEALTLIRARGEAESREGISTMMDLAIAEQHRAAAPAHALALAREAAELARRTLSPDDPLLPDLLNGLGYVLKMQGHLDPAQAAYEEALELNRRLLGSDHCEVASCLNNLGALLEDRSDYEGAIRLYREALAIDEQRFGPDHIKAGIRLNNIGRVLNKAGRAAEALECQLRVLAIYEPGYGRQHFYTAMARVHLGNAHLSLGQVGSARTSFAEALPVLERYYGPANPICGYLRQRLEELSGGLCR